MARDVGDYGQNDFGPTILESCIFLSPILSGVLHMFSSDYLPPPKQILWWLLCSHLVCSISPPAALDSVIAFSFLSFLPSCFPPCFFSQLLYVKESYRQKGIWIPKWFKKRHKWNSILLEQIGLLYTSSINGRISSWNCLLGIKKSCPKSQDHTSRCQFLSKISSRLWFYALNPEWPGRLIIILLRRKPGHLKQGNEDSNL